MPLSALFPGAAVAADVVAVPGAGANTRRRVEQDAGAGTDREKVFQLICKQVLAVSLQSRILRSIMIAVFLVPADSDYVLQPKKGTGQYAETMKAEALKGVARRDAEKSTASPTCGHGQRF